MHPSDKDFISGKWQILPYIASKFYWHFRNLSNQNLISKFVKRNVWIKLDKVTNPLASKMQSAFSQNALCR